MNTFFGCSEFRSGFFWRLPEVAFQVHARLDNGDAFAFEEFSLQRSVRLADEDFAALTDDPMPGDAFSRGSGGHRAASGTRAARKAQGFSERPIS